MTIARYLHDGLVKAGADVTVVGPYTHRHIPWHGGMELAEKYVWKPDLALPMGAKLATEPLTIASVCEKLGRSDFDVVIQTDPEYALIGDAPSGCPVTCFAVDNHVRDYRQRPWDYIFGAHSWGYRHNEEAFRWLPCAYDPDWHFDKGLARPVDVAIVGVLAPNGDTYKTRMDGINALVSNGFSVVMATGKVYDEYNNIYNTAKMAYCASANGDLACRVFENMAQGCLVLTDRVGDLTRLGFVEDMDYLGYSNMAELVVQAERGMDKDLRAEIVERARAMVEVHTWQNRAETLLQEVGL